MNRGERKDLKKKYKEKRKYYDGAKCKNSKCGICSIHKKFKKTSKFFKKSQLLQLILIKEIKK
jgi:hypothetical protein